MKLLFVLPTAFALVCASSQSRALMRVSAAVTNLPAAQATQEPTKKTLVLSSLDIWDKGVRLVARLDIVTKLEVVVDSLTNEVRKDPKGAPLKVDRRYFVLRLAPYGNEPCDDKWRLAEWRLVLPSIPPPSVSGQVGALSWNPITRTLAVATATVADNTVFLTVREAPLTLAADSHTWPMPKNITFDAVFGDARTTQSCPVNSLEFTDSTETISITLRRANCKLTQQLDYDRAKRECTVDGVKVP